MPETRFSPYPLKIDANVIIKDVVVHLFMFRADVGGVKEEREENIQPSLMAGGIKVSLIFLTFLLIPVVLSIVHKRKKANRIVLYVAIALILINFLVFPYYLTQLFNTFNSI